MSALSACDMMEIESSSSSLCSSSASSSSSSLASSSSSFSYLTTARNNSNRVRLIVILFGTMGSGKDFMRAVIFRYFKSLGRVPMGLGLADPFKLVVCARDGIAYERVFVTKDEVSRRLLQERGGGAGIDADAAPGSYGPRTWWDIGMHAIRAHSEREVDDFIISDSRFPQVMDWANELGLETLTIPSATTTTSTLSAAAAPSLTLRGETKSSAPSAPSSSATAPTGATASISSATSAASTTPTIGASNLVLNDGILTKMLFIRLDAPKRSWQRALSEAKGDEKKALQISSHITEVAISDPRWNDRYHLIVNNDFGHEESAVRELMTFISDQMNILLSRRPAHN